MSNHRKGDPADILLVEDNPGDVRLTQEAFKDGDIRNTLHVVTDGVAAMDFLAQRGDYADAPRPDIVLLDLNLPQKNGDEVLEEMRDDADLRCIPVIVLTSSLRPSGHSSSSGSRSSPCPISTSSVLHCSPTALSQFAQ